MSYGYAGKIIRINLSNENITIEKPDDKFYRTYIGAKGFAAYYLLKELPPGIDPLSPENKLIFVTGILTGVPVAAMPRFVVSAKSPLTGGYGQSEAGGYWGPELKRAGYDGIIIEGKASKPVYLYINNNHIEIRNAEHIWGKEMAVAQDTIRRELGDDKIRIAMIGPGGENLVRYACIINELKHANGRNGLGAVMGSKNLKAVAVRGTKDVSFADPEKITEIRTNTIKTYMNHPLTRTLYDLGTSSAVMSLNAGGILPTQNFIYGEMKSADNISGETLEKTILKKREGCYACPIRCKRVVEINSQEIAVDPKYGGPEYETVGSFGSLCGIDDLKIIAKANELCNKYGLDTISTGSSIAFAMECFSRGILTKDDFDGIEVSFGNGEAALQLIEKIAKREGIGDLLAEGTERASKKIGKGSEEFVMAVKGQEIPMHDPRGKVGVGIGYAVSETGADHMIAAHDPLISQAGVIFDSVASLGILEPLDPMDMSTKKVRAFAYLQMWWSFLNMAGVCDFGPVPRGCIPVDDMVALVKFVTGWDTSLWEIMKAGERAINMTRLFNVREGFGKNDDTLPTRLFEPLKNGRLEGTRIEKEDFKEAISIYYKIMGWDAEGIPTEGKLMELGLDYLIGFADLPTN
jgi:aldehyde:ferredoxin oxidoreductase